MARAFGAESLIATTEQPGNLKEKSMESLICYCLGLTLSDIKRDLLENGQSTILEKILSEKKAGGCRCAVNNPMSR